MSAFRLHRPLGALALFALTACYNEAAYEADYTEAMCEKTFECYDDAQQENLLWEDESTCVAQRDDQDTTSDDCDFDGNSAQACVEDTQALNCQEFYAGRWPSTCETVCGE
ncbi:MAG: hypothetical protein ACI9VR_000779 [Cognaticolwellia sp.]|jgi:hypothetical protein